MESSNNDDPNALIQFGRESTVGTARAEHTSIEPIIEVEVQSLPTHILYLLWWSLPANSKEVVLEHELIKADEFASDYDVATVRGDLEFFLKSKLRYLAEKNYLEYLEIPHNKLSKSKTGQVADDISTTLSNMVDLFFDKPRYYFVGNEIENLDLDLVQKIKLRSLLNSVAQEAACAVISGLEGKTNLGERKQSFHLIDDTGYKLNNLTENLVEVFESKEQD
jgi:hypothetical protein